MNISSQPQTNVGYLILSSTLGIIVGDVLWLEALRLLGAKHVIVIDSLKPFAAAILGRVGLGEVLLPPAWGGMVLTVIGVGVVSWEEQRTPTALEEEENDNEKLVSQTEATERIGNDEEDIEQLDNVNIADQSETNARNEEEQTTHNNSHQQSSMETEANMNDDSKVQAERKHYRRGYTCAIVNVLADSLGSLVTKKYGVGMTTWSINLIRFGFAGVVLVCISIGMRFHRRCTSKLKEPIEKTDEATSTDRKESTITTPKWFELPILSRIGWLYITAGVGFVTFLCPALSNYALFQIALGLAVALGSIGPLYGLVLDWPFKGKRPTMCGCVGVLLTIAGVVILCVWGS